MVEPASLPTEAEPLAVRQDHYCFGCGRQNPHGLKLTFFADPDGTVWTRWIPQRENEGFTGMAHGGIITTVLDEVMGWTTYYRRIWAVTAKLDVSFRKPVAIGEPTRALARVTSESGRRVQLVAELRRESDRRLLAEANAVFVKVPEDQARAWQDRYFDPAAAPAS